MMELLKLTGKKLRGMHFGLLPCIMFVLMTIRTLTAGSGVMISGLCVAFLPFFAQLRTTTCTEETISEEKEILSIYLLNLLLVTVGMFYLKGLVWLGSTFYAGYEASPILHELFLLTYICDLAFISIITPLTYTLQQAQRTMLAVLMANLELGFMFLSNKLLLLTNHTFVLDQQWGLYLLAILLPAMSLGSVVMKGKQKKDTANTVATE